MLASRKGKLLLLVVLLVLIAGLVFTSGCAKEEKAKPKVVKPTSPLTAEIKVDKSTAKAGETLKYTLLLTNNTSKPLEGLKIKLVHPSGTGFGMRQEGGPQPSVDEQTRTWTWDIGTLQAKGSFWFSFTTEILADAPSGVTISAKYDVEGDGLSKPISSNTVTTKTP